MTSDTVPIAVAEGTVRGSFERSISTFFNSWADQSSFRRSKRSVQFRQRVVYGGFSTKHVQDAPTPMEEARCLFPHAWFLVPRPKKLGKAVSISQYVSINLIEFIW